jgi:4-hydroxybenzoate polyprenyltransferase
MDSSMVVDLGIVIALGIAILWLIGHLIAGFVNGKPTGRPTWYYVVPLVQGALVLLKHEFVEPTSSLNEPLSWLLFAFAMAFAAYVFRSQRKDAPQAADIKA